MSKFFKELTDMVTDNSPGKVLGATMLILVFAGSVALGLAYWLTHRH